MSEKEKSEIPGPMSDADIREAMASRDIIIKPFSDESLTPVGYDLRVGDEGWIWTKKGLRSVNIRDKNSIVLEPGDNALIVTMEDVSLSKRIRGTIHAKVSVSSLSFMDNSTTIDPTWGNKGGFLLIHMANIGMLSLELKHGEPFCTVLFSRLVTPAEGENLKEGKREDIRKRIDQMIRDRRERSKGHKLLTMLKSDLGVIICSLLVGFGGTVLMIYLSTLIFPNLSPEVRVAAFFVSGPTISAGLMTVLTRRR
jgi:dCTP deaminase